MRASSPLSTLPPWRLILAARGAAPGGLLREVVKDDLARPAPGIIQRHARLLDLLHAHAVVLDLAGPLQLVESLEGGVLTVHLCGRAVDLQEVQGFDAEVPEAPLDDGGEDFGVVALRGGWVEAAR